MASAVDTEHLVLSLLEQEGGLAISIFNKANVDIEPYGAVSSKNWRRCRSLFAPGRRGASLHHPSAEQALNPGRDESKKLGDQYISIEHVLLASQMTRAPRVAFSEN